ncbi:hypothetical protein BDZ45DRAFT_747654 [Acephala macrosclerotiorum]|nr:hypothetical protein BDZ45DRAFT_747654 [Acephala macrosclerotiorum]
MAIVFAELCEHAERPLVERAWTVAEASFAKYKASLRDPTLWGSLEKLRRKAQSARSVKSSIIDRRGIRSTNTNTSLAPRMLQTNILPSQFFLELG